MESLRRNRGHSVPDNHVTVNYVTGELHQFLKATHEALTHTAGTSLAGEDHTTTPPFR